MNGARRTRLALSAILVAGATLCLASGAPADQLVLRDGRSIATRGAVKLDARRAVYTDLSGNLATLRIEEIDVVRTQEAAKAAAAKTGPATIAAPKPPVLRLTDADVAHVEDESTAGTRDTAAPPVVTLYATSWCGWCRKSRQLMQSLGIAFVEKDVESDPRAAAEKSRLAPGFGVPVLVRGSAVVRGYSEATIRSWAPASPAAKE